MPKKSKPDCTGYRMVDGKAYRVEAYVDFTKLFDKMAPKAARNRAQRTKIGSGAITIVAKAKESADG